ncbi:HNH endonuclease [Atlantibacter hermannii]|uniref:HNH endonuclease n=1 Tax=Atlantibacter hermannii TaxID=565 RepID=UPI0028ADEABA|nr:HNH endonuclease [Atlantibacter hermannii]MEB7923148.1 HNH endonuclease [Atlantibacter hermannii]
MAVVPRQSAPSKKMIWQYWIDNGIQRGLDDTRYYNACDFNVCVCCGRESSTLERAHIIPHSLGGSNDVSNYILLCNKCHTESPDIANESALIEWMNEQPTELESMLRLIQYEIDKYNKETPMMVNEIIINEILSELYKKAGSHGGRFSHATKVYIIREALKKIFSQNTL